MKTLGYAARSSRSSLQPFSFTRQPPRADEVQIQVLYCGVCHSDLHQARNDWDNTLYPCVPGHEIVGRVTAFGKSVRRFKAGELVAVGCMIDSCRKCPACRESLEQYCEGPNGTLATYNGPFEPDGSNTYGGYSEQIVVHDHFVLKVPRNLDPQTVAPLLCAGVTTYSPLKHWRIKQGDVVGVVGLGGLGHMAVKLAAAMGARVTVFSTTPSKQKDAHRFGADRFVLSTEKRAMQRLGAKFDFVLSTIPDAHDINPYIGLLKRDATLAVVGTLVPFTKPTDSAEVAFHRRSVAGSLIGGIAETQEVLNFCGRHNITADVELIPMAEINDAFNRMEAGRVRYRYVIDIGNTLRA